MISEARRRGATFLLLSTQVSSNIPASRSRVFLPALDRTRLPTPATFSPHAENEAKNLIVLVGRVPLFLAQTFQIVLCLSERSTFVLVGPNTD